MLNASLTIDKIVLCCGMIKDNYDNDLFPTIYVIIVMKQDYKYGLTFT